MAESSSASTPQPMKPRRRGRRVLLLLAGLVLLLLVLVLLAPTLISLGLGQGLIRNAAASSVNGTLDIKSMSLGWFSGQKIEGVRIVDASGKEAANLSITVNNSLLSLATGGAGSSTPFDVTISGSVAGQLREDGSISFTELLKEDPAKAKSPKPASNKPKKPLRDAIPRAIVNIAGLNVTLDDLKNKQSLKIDDLKGKFAYVDPEQPITFDLHGKTVTNIADKSGSGGAVGMGGMAGSIDITGQADHVFAADGSITLRGAAAKLDVKATGLPLPLQVQERNATLQTFAMNIASDDLTDRIAITMTGEAQIEGAAKPTNIKLDGSIGKALDGDGKLSLRVANAQFTGELTNVPVSSNGETGVQGEMSTLALTIFSDDLTKKIEVAATGEGMINGNQPSALSANLALADPFTPAGGFQFALDKLTGSASGTRVPTSLAQPMLAGLGIDAARDLGPTVDVEAFFPGGGGGDLMVSATAANAKAEVAAKSNADGSITGSKLALQLPHADPALIAALTNKAVFSDRPLNINIDVTSFHVPAPDKDTKAIPLGQFAAKGALSVSGPAGVRAEGAQAGDETTTSASTPATVPTTAPAKPPLVPLERIDLKFDTPALAQHVTLVGNAKVGGGSIVIDERITNLFDANGVLAAAKAKPEGSIEIDNLPVETILAFAPPEHADLITQIIGREMFAELRTTPMDAGLKTEVAARTDAATIDISMVGRPDGSLQLDVAVINATITPELAAVAQKASANPVVLGGPAKVLVELRPILLPMGAVADLLSSPFSGKVALTDANIAKAPGLADALIIPSLTADLTMQMRGGDISAAITDGRATLKRGAAKADIATLTIAGTYVSKDGVTSPNLDVNFADLHTREAEALLGMTPGTIANWTGDRGGLDVHVETEAAGYSATAKSNMPNVQGTFTAAMKDELVSITAETSKLVLGKNALQARLNPPPPVDGNAPDAKVATAAKDTLITVDADVPVQLAISRLEFPMKMLNREAFDAGLVNMDIALTGGPLKTTTKDGVRSTLTDLRMSLKAADISKGVQFALKGDAESITPAPPPPPLQQPKPATPAPANAATATPPAKSLEEMTPEERRDARREERRQERTATSQPSAPAVESKPPPPPTPAPTTAPSEPVRMAGQLDVTGSMLDVVNSAGVLDMAGSRLQMNANAANVPTAVADALADMQGLLVAAVGPQMNAEFVADDFSANTGTLNAKINTTNGSLTAVLRGKDNSLRVNKNAPVMAELEITPALRERLLLKIHPILADVRTTEQPLRVEIPTALAAIPADVSKLRAEINITVGKVELDSGSTTLKLLSFIGAGDRGTIPGEIEPIRAQIRNGIVTYDKFSVHIDKYTLNYSGQIDLVKDEVNLRTEIPLKALNDQFPQLRDYAESIVVPLVTRGKFGALKTTIDPDFDIAKAALNAGFKGTLGNILGGDAGGLLDGLLNKDKDKKNEGGAIANPPERPRRRDRPTTQPQG